MSRKVTIQTATGNTVVVCPDEGKVYGQLTASGTRKEIYTSTTQRGYHKAGCKTKSGVYLYPEIYRSRLVWVSVNGPIPKGMQINHINHNRTDDRIQNLELVTCQQNVWYVRKKKLIQGKPTSTQYKGVHKHRNKYMARIRTDTGRLHLGYFTCPIEAAFAYDKAAKQHHGKYAVLNFPDKEVV
jgi:hypothetical protein